MDVSNTSFVIGDGRESLVSRIKTIVKSVYGLETSEFEVLECTNHRYITLLVLVNADHDKERLKYLVDRLNKCVDMLFELEEYHLNTYINVALKLKNGDIIGEIDVDYSI